MKYEFTITGTVEFDDKSSGYMPPKGTVGVRNWLRNEWGIGEPERYGFVKYNRPKIEVKSVG
jgi:hypothetical protein